MCEYRSSVPWSDHNVIQHSSILGTNFHDPTTLQAMQDINLTFLMKPMVFFNIF